MTNGIMQRLTYDNPPQYDSYKSYRKYLRGITGYACAYCTVSESESLGATFVIEHFRPQKLFPGLKSVCANLRYTCPRCNSYKSDLWISTEQGCIRNCTSCHSKACEKNIERFLDGLHEDPSISMYVDSDHKIHAYSGSFVAKYTIEFLRLNRAQLIKLRYLRWFMNDWANELNDRLRRALGENEELVQRQRAFQEYRSKRELSGARDQTLCNTIETMYDIMILQGERTVDLIKFELEKLQHLLANHTGSDMTLSPCPTSKELA